MRSLSLPLFACALFSCAESPEKEDPTGIGLGDSAPPDSEATAGDDSASGDADSPTDPGCGIALSTTLPENGATNVEIGSTLSFTLSAADPTAAVTTAIPGAQSWLDDTTLVFTPSAALDPSTSYTATLDWCGGSQELAFTTADPPREDLVGRSWIVDLTQGTVTDPAGLGALLVQVAQTTVLLGVSSADYTSLEMLGAPRADNGTQLYCLKSIDFPTPATFENPHFALAADEVDIPLVDYVQVPAYDFEVSGDFSDDGTEITGGRLSGTLDLREVAPYTDFDVATMCELVLAFGGACIPCDSDAEPFCVHLVIEDMWAEEAEGVTVVDINAAGCEDCLWEAPEPETCP